MNVNMSCRLSRASARLPREGSAACPGWVRPCNPLAVLTPSRLATPQKAETRRQCTPPTARLLTAESALPCAAALYPPPPDLPTDAVLLAAGKGGGHAYTPLGKLASPNHFDSNITEWTKAFCATKSLDSSSNCAV